MSVKPLRYVLVYQSLLTVILPFAVMVIMGIVWIVPQIRSNSEMRNLQLAKAVGMQVEGHLDAAGAIVRAAAAMQRVTPLVFQRQLDALLGSTDVMSSLYVVGPDGYVSDVALNTKIKHLSEDLLSLNLSYNPLLREIARNNMPLWSEAFLSVIDGGLAAAYGVPAKGVTVIGEVDLTHFTRFLTQISTEKDILILIIDRNGQVLADNKGLYTAQQLNIGNIDLVRTGIASSKPTTGRFKFYGQSMTGSIVKTSTVNWHVMVAMPDMTIYQTTMNIAMIVMAGILVALLCALLTSVYQARRLAARFDAINQHARTVAEGGAAAEWPTSSVSEFNQLSANLQLMSRRLQESEMLYRTLFEQTPDGVVLWSIPDLMPVQFNPAAHNMLGYTSEEFSHLSVNDLEYEKNDKFRADFMALLQRDGAASFESIYCTKSHEPCHVLITVKLISLAGRQVILSLRRDLAEVKRGEAERSRLEQQLLHAQKLESLGVLAGGIAHDFNNILMVIIGNVGLALMRISKESPVVKNLIQIEQAAARAADLAKQMLAYSGKGKFLIEVLNLNNLLQEMLHMLEVSISKKAVLRLDLNPELPLVEADATQMRQIVMNLVINASESLGDKSGVIAIATGCMMCDHGYLKDVWQDEGLADGLYVSLEVSDAGCGMDRETLGKIFDPFFSTKFTGRGLGMAAVLGIVRGHRGAIKVYSEPGKGTTFKILLPVIDKPATVFNHDSCVDSWQGSGTVLLVDDEESVRGIGSAMLKELGFAVITASDGQDALDIFRNRPEISFVILDLTMPRMDGEQCFRELRRLRPDVKVIISSGYNEQEVTQKFTGKGLAGFVQKPYRLSVLMDAIKAIQ